MCVCVCVCVSLLFYSLCHSCHTTVSLCSSSFCAQMKNRLFMLSVSFYGCAVSQLWQRHEEGPA